MAQPYGDNNAAKDYESMVPFRQERPRHHSTKQIMKYEQHYAGDFMLQQLE